MFRKELESKFKSIFGVEKVSFSAPSSANEQGVLFVNITNVRSNISGEKICNRVTGDISIFNVEDKLPFGFFQKKIELAKKLDVENFSFYNFDSNNSYGGAGGLVEKSLSFLYLYSADFNPGVGEISEMNYIEGE